MNYHGKAPLIDALAAQYALGTLRGAARRRFERLCRQDAATLRALHRWEDRLIDLATGIRPVQPSAAVWGDVQQRIRKQGAASRARPRWSVTQWAMAASVAFAVIAMSWLFLVGASTDLIATVADPQQAQLWRIEATTQRDELRIATSADVPLDADHAYELWALSPSGGAPVSLGVLPQRGSLRLALSAAQRRALTSAQQVAISREPRGGSPTGAPTGPVLYVAPVAMES